MKTAREIIERAQVQLVLKNRLSWEEDCFGGRFHTVEERQRQQSLESSLISSQCLDRIMDTNDWTLLNQRIGTIDMKCRAWRAFECEVIEPLLWACGLVIKLTPIDKFSLANFGRLLVDTPTYDLCQTAILRDQDQILRQRNIFMLWYWRCQRHQEFDGVKGNSVISAIAKEFTSQVVVCAKSIKRINGDFAVFGKPFSEITQMEKCLLGLRARWRYHALEWVLNNESWYNTCTGTWNSAKPGKDGA